MSTLFIFISQSLWRVPFLEKFKAYSESLMNYPSLDKHLTPSSTMIAITCCSLNLTLNLLPFKTSYITPVRWGWSWRNVKRFFDFEASIFLPRPPLTSLKVGTLICELLFTPFLSFLPLASAYFNCSRYLLTSSSVLICCIVTNPCSSM